jgi:hypothetical protein
MPFQALPLDRSNHVWKLLGENMHTHTQTHTHTHTHTHARTHAHTHAHAHTCTCTHMPTFYFAITFEMCEEAEEAAL